METENYLRIMIDSLKKKETILEQIIAYNIEQQKLLDAIEFDGDAFQTNMEKKSNSIDELNSLDEGFQMVYNRIKDGVELYKQNYKEDIRQLQEMIKKVTSLGATIQAQESRNKIKAEMKFRQLRSDAQNAKRSVSMANKYYKNMSMVSSEPQFMDKKK